MRRVGTVLLFSLLSRRAVVWLGLAAWLFMVPGVRAHPLDEFYQVTFITVAPDRINLKVELYTGVLIAPQILTLVDGDQDEQISEAEKRAYVEHFLTNVTFEIDHAPTPLAFTHLEFPNAVDLRAGVGIIRFTLYVDLPATQPGQHQLYYRNNHLPDIANYVVNALSDDPIRVQLGRQERDVFQTELRLDYTVRPEALIESTPDVPPAIEPAPVELTWAGPQRLTRYLYDPELSAPFLGVIVGLSIVLGGFHALAPGHGKTLVAAYLIGSRGTIRHAMVLGGVVTFTHTVSVVVIGLLALVASQFMVPRVMVPLLETLSGLLVVYIGFQLVWQRWRDYQKGTASHFHGHDHAYEAHDHGHHHHLPEQVSMRNLLALGISGGLVPCPEALGIMLIAIGLNRILLGLGLVVAFSFGLAGVLMIIGILLVRAKSLFDRFGDQEGRWQALLPLVSAMIVTLLGIGLVVKGLMPYLKS
jgi:ABC-type nickel/cobalt efflux system permease component RcnA